jgi:hypothetical protein
MEGANIQGAGQEVDQWDRVYIGALDYDFAGTLFDKVE